MNKKKIIALGVSVGLMAGMGVNTFADDVIQYVTASINETFQFKVNGEKTEVDDEYEVLVYKDRVYVPVRAVGEMIGAEVDWDDVNKTVIINHSAGADGNEQQGSGTDGSQDVDDNQSGNTGQGNGSEDSGQDSDNGNNSQDSDGENGNDSEVVYEKFPVIYEDTNFRVDATAYFDDNNGGRLYIKVENKADAVLRLNSSATKYTINGETFGIKDVAAGSWDTRWYTQYVEEDGVLEGYLRLPQELDDFENISLHIELQYDGKSGAHGVDFNIAV